MRCRRCNSSRLILLNKKWAQDNDIYRCQECGFLFSPSHPRDNAASSIDGLEPGLAPKVETSRTVAVSAGFHGQA